MSEEIRARLDLLKTGIDNLHKYELSAKIHCSKINSLLTPFFQLRPLLESFVIKKKGISSRKVKKDLKELNKSLGEFQTLCETCSSEGTLAFQEFIVKTSIKSIFDQFFTIRQTVIKLLNKVGMPDAANLFVASPEQLCNENQVDLKRLYTFLLQLKSAGRSIGPKELMDELSKRLDSMSTHGLYGDDGKSQVIDVPKTNQFILTHDQLISERLIGNGKSARVSVGRIKGHDELFAIKVLRCRELAPPELESLRREIVILSTLSHPSLLRLRGYTSEQPFSLVTDYMSNGSLFAFLEKRPHELSPTERSIIALDVAAGMAYMHEQRVMHRDLKSLNILLDDKKRAKICDFGLSRLMTYEPMSGYVGTAQWMAPEVFLSQPSYDDRIDVYSFGIVLWELLTSKVPYDGIDLGILPKMVVHDGLRPEIPRDTPPELVTLMTSCWNANPMLRPSFQQITQLLSSPRYMFPGTDFGKIPRHNIRHSVSSSDPLKVSSMTLEHSRRYGSDASMNRLFEPIDTNIVQLYDAVQNCDNAALDRVIEDMRIALKDKSITASPQQYVRDLMRLITETKDNRRCRIMKILVESFIIPNIFHDFLSSGGVEFLCDVLDDQDAETTDLIMSVLESNPSIELFTIPMIRHLLAFYDYPEIQVRTRVLTVLLVAAHQQRNFLCSLPTFIGHLLDFTLLQLPERLWDGLLATLDDFLMGIDTVRESLIVNINQLLIRVPKELKKRAVRCILSALRFQEIRNAFPEQYWIMADEDFELYKPFFTSFLESPPENPKAMIKALFAIAGHNDDALATLMEFVEKYSATIAVCLPVGNRNCDDVLIKLYYALIQNGQAETVYEVKEFYLVVLSLLEQGFSDFLCQLLRNASINVELARSVGYPDVLSKAINRTSDNDVLWGLLSIVYKWCKISYVPEFEPLIPKLITFLQSDKETTSLGAFLCLTLFVVHSEQVDIQLVLKKAFTYLSDERELIRTISVEFIDNNRREIVNDIVAYVNLFAELYKDHTPTKITVKAAKVLNRIVHKQKPELAEVPREVLSRFAHFSRSTE